MLAICTDTLPQSCLSYVAFRVAFQETIERIALARQMSEDETDGFGYLTEVPFLRSVPPHVQLDLLAETWSKHSASESIEASFVDEAVVYAACETSARIAEEDPADIARYLKRGPQQVSLAGEKVLPSRLRSLHLNLSNEGDFLMISQFEDMQPDESRWLKRKFHIDETKLQVMFDALARWHISPAFAKNLKGLLSPREIARALAFFGVQHAE
jgi:hypothetical protein